MQGNACLGKISESVAESILPFLGILITPFYILNESRTRFVDRYGMVCCDSFHRKFSV